jgi:hypothetical protein
MEIEEIKIKKVSVESAIINLLNNFEVETGMNVYDIRLNRATIISKQGSFIYQVELDVRL